MKMTSSKVTVAAGNLIMSTNSIKKDAEIIIDGLNFVLSVTATGRVSSDNAGGILLSNSECKTTRITNCTITASVYAMAFDFGLIGRVSYPEAALEVSNCVIKYPNF